MVNGHIIVDLSQDALLVAKEKASYGGEGSTEGDITGSKNSSKA